MLHCTRSKETLEIRSPRPISPDSPESLSGHCVEPHEPHRIGVPDGGRRAWLVVLGGFINFTASFGAFVPAAIPNSTNFHTRPS